MDELDIVVERVQKMEELFDLLLENDTNKINEDNKLKEAFDTLLEYYSNGMWLHDYELDNMGLLPKELKRGILSQDGFYNLLFDMNNS